MTQLRISVADDEADMRTRVEGRPILLSERITCSASFFDIEADRAGCDTVPTAGLIATRSKVALGLRSRARLTAV